MVETAIVMPLMLFIILGLLQLMLMHQARYMTKYAAYKAARAGAVHRAKVSAMEDAALAVLLPMAGRTNQESSAFKASSGMEYVTSWNSIQGNTQYGFKVAEVTTCHPLRGQINQTTDFEDPARVAGGDWKSFDNSKLMVQVTFYYRMFIPFANGVLWWITYGQENQELLRVMRLAKIDKGSGQAQQGTLLGTKNEKRTIQEVAGLAQQKIYILPIRASYAVRMQSNVLDSELPQRNECQVPWKKKN